MAKTAPKGALALLAELERRASPHGYARLDRAAREAIAHELNSTPRAVGGWLLDLELAGAIARFGAGRSRVAAIMIRGSSASSSRMCEVCRVRAPGAGRGQPRCGLCQRHHREDAVRDSAFIGAAIYNGIPLDEAGLYRSAKAAGIPLWSWSDDDDGTVGGVRHAGAVSIAIRERLTTPARATLWAAREARARNRGGDSTSDDD